MLFDFQLDASYLINDAIEKNKIFILSGENGIGKKHIIRQLECSYNKYPIIENAYSVKDLLIQMLIYNNKTSGIDIQFGLKGFNIPVTQIYHKFYSFIKSDFDNLENKVLEELTRIAKSNNLLLTIQLYKITSKSLVDFICNKLIKLNLKIILIIDSEDINTLKFKDNLPDFPSIIVECNKEKYYTEFQDKLSKEDIDKILTITTGKVRYIIEIYKYLSINESSNYIEYNQLKFSEIKHENPDAYILLEFLSYFENYFSIKEIKYIYNKLYEDLKVYNNLNCILNFILKNNILKENNSIYSFVLSLFKQILRENNNDNRVFYLTLGQCVRDLYPLDLDIQLFFYSKAEDKYANIIKLLLAIRSVRNEFSTDETFEIIYTIESLHIKQIAQTIINAYKNYYNSEFDKAIQTLLEIDPTSDSIITNETNYLLALCYWKKSNEFKVETHELLEAIIDDSNTFEETILLSKLTLLSIYANDAQYHKKNKLKLYNELKNYIREKINEDRDYELLLNILKRKSNSIFPTKQCINDLKNSYEYFFNHQYFFYEEYAMSLCNYSAALLCLGRFEESNNCYEKLNWNNLHDSYKLYNYNNYILSEFFLNNHTINNSMIAKIKDFEKLLQQCKTSVDTKILLYINIAGLKVYKGQYTKAQKLYEFAEKLNNDYDDYFVYYVNINLCVLAIINNDYMQANKLFQKCNFVPELFSTYEKQYLNKRNEIINNVIKNQIPNITIDKFSKLLSKGLNDAFLTNNIDFFTSAILFSDIQFWTEN